LVSPFNPKLLQYHQVSLSRHPIALILSARLAKLSTFLQGIADIGH
jgi:hypothetical protein